MLPPAPLVADPVRRVIIPLLPSVVALPDVSDNDPDTPFEPAFALRTLKAPLDVARPYPVISEIAPPVTAVASPLVTVTRPPAVSFPLPTIMLTLPAAPFVAEPVRRVIFPLLPLLVVPDVNESELDTDKSPPFAVRTLKAPLDVALP
jgi:hypothetical protein